MTELTPSVLRALLPQVEAMAIRAGAAVMAVYATDFTATWKEDRSPVTKADLAAEEIITPALQALLPNVPVVAEEAASRGERPTVGDELFWLVDPLDGTREFLARNDEFTVNIALVAHRRPVLGVVFAPALQALYSGIAGEGATQRVTSGPAAGTPMRVRATPTAGVTLVASRRHGDQTRLQRLVGAHRIADIRNAGSSLKFCLIAAGEADIYPRTGPTCEWDTAAGQAVLEAAGGQVTLEDGHTPLSYAKRADFLNPGFIAWGHARGDDAITTPPADA